MTRTNITHAGIDLDSSDDGVTIRSCDLVIDGWGGGSISSTTFSGTYAEIKSGSNISTLILTGTYASLSNGSGFSPFNLTANAITTNTTMSFYHAGLTTLSSSTGGAKTITMPLASAVPGAFFTIRSLSADAHVLTSTQETNGTKVFCKPSYTSAFSIEPTGSNGSAITFPAIIGSSVSMMCDGVNFLVLGGSGTITFSGE